MKAIEKRNISQCIISILLPSNGSLIYVLIMLELLEFLSSEVYSIWAKVIFNNFPFSVSYRLSRLLIPLRSYGSYLMLLFLILNRFFSWVFASSIVLFHINITNKGFFFGYLVKSVDSIIILLKTIHLFLEEHSISIVRV